MLRVLVTLLRSAHDLPNRGLGGSRARSDPENVCER